MNRTFLRIFPVAALVTLIVSCHPEGCYGPKSFGYNTRGVITSNLFGVYTLDGVSKYALSGRNFTNHLGSIELKPDMTVVFTDIPSMMGIPEKGVYLSSAGKWRIVRTEAIWEVEVYDIDLGGFTRLTFPVIGEVPPHGIELVINHDEGYWIRFQKTSKASLVDSAQPR